MIKLVVKSAGGARGNSVAAGDSHRGGIAVRVGDDARFTFYYFTKADIVINFHDLKKLFYRQHKASSLGHNPTQ